MVTTRPREVVRLRRGDPSQRPIFVLHDATGGVLSSVLLARTLDNDRPVYGVGARSDADRMPVDATVEEMARSAVAVIRAVQPTGPYTLIGYSFGTAVAHETARTLLAADQSVEQVVMLDPYVGYRNLPMLARWWFLLVQRPRHVLRWLAYVDPQERRRFLRRVVSVVVPGVGRIPNITDVEPDKAMLAHAQVAVDALADHHPGPLSAPVTIVNCASKFPAQCDPLPVLRPLLSDLTVLELPGDHADMVAAPGVARTAALVDQAVAKAS